MTYKPRSSVDDITANNKKSISSKKKWSNSPICASGNRCVGSIKIGSDIKTPVKVVNHGDYCSQCKKTIYNNTSKSFDKKIAEFNSMEALLALPIKERKKIFPNESRESYKYDNNVVCIVNDEVNKKQYHFNSAGLEIGSGDGFSPFINF